MSYNRPLHLRAGSRLVVAAIVGLIGLLGIAILLWLRPESAPANSTAILDAAVEPPNLNEITTKAEQGDATAQNQLGELYLKGRGVRPDSKIAAQWFTKSAAQGHALGQFNLGTLFEAGQGVAVDYAQAAQLHRKAAEQGLAWAQYSLATMYVFGRGVPRDEAEAVKWLSRAARQGDGLAEYAIGERCKAGRGVSQDFVEAFKWFSLAASQKVADAAVARDQLKAQMSRRQIAEGRKRAEQFIAQPENKNR